MRFEKVMRIRFGHTDPAGIAYYPRFFEWFHDAFEDFFEAAVGQPYARVLEEGGVGFPAVQAACEFKRPVRFGDEVVVEVFLSRFSERSATFEYRVKKDGALLGTATVKVAGISMKTKTPAPFPAHIMTAFEAYTETDEDGPNVSRLRG